MSIRGSELRFLRLAGLGLLAACANPAADSALYAQNALVGMPKQTLLSCAGVPDGQAVVGDREFFTYRSSRIVSYPVTTVGAFGGWGRPWGHPWGWGPGWPAFYGADVRSYTCDATFTLRNGVVERLVYGGAPGGGSTLGQCYHVVQNCLALVQQQTAPSPGVPKR
ncbi:MAG TPA: hypothetical protein VD978_07350 [Azospirillum sp.]|nr:hypothetical protein [Azospirillum sp.]